MATHRAAIGTVNAVNVFAPDGLVARKQSGSYRYYQFDQQGNTVYRTNSSGAQLSTACYNAYGKNFNAPVAGDTFRYNARWGYRYDGDLFMSLCQHRFYDAGQGRWINRDPIGFAGGVNLYGYCESGPVGGTDPSGHDWVYALDIYATFPPSDAPPWNDVTANVEECHRFWASLEYSLPDSATDFDRIGARNGWLTSRVKTGGIWDFKYGGNAKYEDYGNWHFGVVGRSLGFSEYTLLSGAGAYQIRSGTSRLEYGVPGIIPPYGDDPVDQSWIKRGIRYADLFYNHF